jgi:hypothetical protein
VGVGLSENGGSRGEAERENEQVVEVIGKI